MTPIYLQQLTSLYNVTLTQWYLTVANKNVRALLVTNVGLSVLLRLMVKTVIQLSVTIYCYDLRQGQVFPRVQALHGLLLLPNKNTQIKFTNSKHRN